MDYEDCRSQCKSLTLAAVQADRIDVRAFCCHTIRLFSCSVNREIMSDEVFDSEDTAAYYNGAAASLFYEACWGGVDIQIGHYVTGEETVA